MSTWAKFRTFRAVHASVRSLLALSSRLRVSRSLDESASSSVCEISHPRVKANATLDDSRDSFDCSPAGSPVIPLTSKNSSRDKCSSRALTRCVAPLNLAVKLEALTRSQTQRYLGPPRRRFSRRRVARDRHIYEGEIEKERELTGAGTNERPRQTFLGRGVKLFGCVASGSLLGRRWLLHQKAREHRGSGFVEPLLEKSVNFLFQIRRMVQSGKFKRLQCWDGGLLKVLPWRADTSRIHFGGSP